MKLVIEQDDQMRTKMELVEGMGSTTADDLIALFLALLEHTVKHLLDKGADAEEMYDTMDFMFWKFMEKCFPDIQPREFDLSDAALLFAQDQIIDKAAKEGKTFEAAMKEYEDEAKAYIKARMGGLS